MHSLPDFPEPVNPAPDLTRLAAFLCAQEYTSLARGTILGYATATGTLEGCPMLEPEDRAEADALLESAWPPVPSVSYAWDLDTWHGEPSRWTTAGVALVPPERDALPGEPDAFGPTSEDLADYAAWAATLPDGMV
jgi:hypothetical protein